MCALLAFTPQSMSSVIYLFGHKYCVSRPSGSLSLRFQFCVSGLCISVGPHHCAEMSRTLVISESGSNLLQDGCQFSGFLEFLCMLFGIGLSVSTIQVVVARPLERFSVFQCGDLGWKHGSPFSGASVFPVNMAVFLGSVCCVRPSYRDTGCFLNLGDVHC